MDLQGLQDMYAGIEPEKTIYRFIMDTTFRSSHKIAAACLHDNLVRLRNLTREIFIDGLSEFEASCPALTQVLREHIRSIGDNLERIKAGLHAKDDAVINDSLEGLNAAIDELVEDSETVIVAIEINKKRGSSGILVQSVERGAIRLVEDLRQGHDECSAEEKDEGIRVTDQTETMVESEIIFHGEREEGEEVTKVANIGSQCGDIRVPLLKQRGEEVEITEELLKAAAKDANPGSGIMELLLGRRGEDVVITEEVLKVAAKNKRQGSDILELLLDRRGEDVVITEEVLKAAAENTLQGSDILELLLDRRGENVAITEEVLKAAAENELQGRQIIALLLHRRGWDVVITEEVLKAAAKNELSGSDILELLVNQRGEEVKITKEMLEAAAKNKLQGKKITALLNDWRYY